MDNVVKTITTQFLIVDTTRKNGDDLGMVYNCFNHIKGMVRPNTSAVHPSGGWTS